MAVGFQVTVDCADPDLLARFWAQALDYQLQPPPPGFASWPEFLAAQGVPEAQWTARAAAVDPGGPGPRLLFQRVPEPKAVKNRVHLDLNVGGGAQVPAPERRARVAAVVERLVELGASRLHDVEEQGEHWVVMQDPEGNEFCVQ